MPNFFTRHRRAIENIALYLLFFCVYCISLNSLPAKLELFEEWVNFYLPNFEREWSFIIHETLSMRPNDSNQSVNAPFWFLLIKASHAIFGTSFFGYRFPCVLLTALAPVLMAEIVRRFFRPDLAFVSGVLLGASQYTMTFGRTGGYIGPTLALELAIVLFGFSVAFEGRRRSWIPLAICLFMVPFFYSTVRYLCVVGLIPIAYRFLFRKEFRKPNLLPAAATAALLIGLGLALTKGGKIEEALVFISARGEQFLITDKTVGEGFEAESIQPQHRLSGVMGEMIPQRLGELSEFYSRGTRFYNHRYFVRERKGFLHPMHHVILVCMALGVLSCLFNARSKQRYLMLPLWSIMAWLPLLVTTGITRNRMLLGIPADLFIAILGACVPLDFVSRYLPEKFKWLPYIILWLGVAIISYDSMSAYFQDYTDFPNL